VILCQDMERVELDSLEGDRCAVREQSGAKPRRNCARERFGCGFNSKYRYYSEI
jgi:hypothetical protein